MGSFLRFFAALVPASLVAAAGSNLCIIRLGCINSQQEFATQEEAASYSPSDMFDIASQALKTSAKKHGEAPTCQTAGSEAPGVGDAFSKMDFCNTQSHRGYRTALLEQRLRRGPSTRPRHGDGDDLVELLQNESQTIVGSGLWKGQDIGSTALAAFDTFRHYEAWDVLSFRETWTDEDTALLLQLLRDEDIGNVTTDFITQRLPSFQDLRALLVKERIAIVGNGDALDGVGEEIDQHAVVARFSNLIGDALDPYHTGSKLDIHVFNVQVIPPEEPDVLQIDLEAILLWTSFCKRMKSLFDSGRRSSKLLMFRPSAFCAFDASIKGFTRGFLFYWFVGSLFNHSDLYGFEGAGHYSHKDKMSSFPVFEPFLEFEHRFYDIAAEDHTATGRED